MLKGGRLLSLIEEEHSIIRTTKGLFVTKNPKKIFIMRFQAFFPNVFVSLFLLLVLAIPGCGTEVESNEKLNLRGEFEQAGLEAHAIFKFHTHEQMIYAGTDSGLYRRRIENNTWELLGPKDATVRAFTVLSNLSFLVSANFNNQDSLTIVQTNDTGNSWNAFRNGYGGNISNSIPTEMEQTAAIPPVLFAGGPGGLDVAKSTDGGRSWKLVLGSWENVGGLFFIKANKKNSNQIWAGGSNAILKPILSKSTNAGESWTQLSVIENVETNLYDLLIQPGNSNFLIAGMGGTLSSANIIRKSTDGGQSWETVYGGVNARTLAHSARDPELVYASGRNADGSLFFAASGDFGDSWQTVEWPESPTGVQVNDITSVMENGREVLYFATNQGVFSYTFEE